MTGWDPVMGKAGGGLQRVMKELKMFPVTFEWSGAHTPQPTLASITLVKWGRCEAPDDSRHTKGLTARCVLSTHLDGDGLRRVRMGAVA